MGSCYPEERWPLGLHYLLMQLSKSTNFPLSGKTRLLLNTYGKTLSFTHDKEKRHLTREILFTIRLAEFRNFLSAVVCEVIVFVPYQAEGSVCLNVTVYLL